MDFIEHIEKGNYDDVNLMSMRALFEMTNSAILRKILVIVGNRSARFRVSSALGALGRRFESYRPDQ